VELSGGIFAKNQGAGFNQVPLPMTPNPGLPMDLVTFGLADPASNILSTSSTWPAGVFDFRGNVRITITAYSSPDAGPYLPEIGEERFIQLQINNNTQGFANSVHQGVVNVDSNRILQNVYPRPGETITHSASLSQIAPHAALQTATFSIRGSHNNHGALTRITAIRILRFL